MSHGSLDMPALLNNLAREQELSNALIGEDQLLDRLQGTVDSFADSMDYFQVQLLGLDVNLIREPNVSFLNYFPKYEAIICSFRAITQSGRSTAWPPSPPVSCQGFLSRLMMLQKTPGTADI